MSDNNTEVVCQVCHSTARVERSSIYGWYNIICQCGKCDYPLSVDQAVLQLAIDVETLNKVSKHLTLSDVPCSC